MHGQDADDQPEPDAVMAQSAVVEHLNNRATRLLSDPRFTDWANTMAPLIGEHEFVSRRLREWGLLRSIAVGQPWTDEDVTSASTGANGTPCTSSRRRTSTFSLPARAGHGVSTLPPVSTCAAETGRPN